MFCATMRIFEQLNRNTVDDATGNPCPPDKNIAVCYFAAAHPQGDHSPEPVRDALKDALNLPLEELRTRRYADYHMEPDQWTFEEVIGSTFTGWALKNNGDGLAVNAETRLQNQMTLMLYLSK